VIKAGVEMGDSHVETGDSPVETIRIHLEAFSCGAMTRDGQVRLPRRHAATSAGPDPPGVDL